MSELPLAWTRVKLGEITAPRGEKANPSDLEELLVRKTKGATGAFIKELMRRSAQFLLEDGVKDLSERHIESALDEMLFSGGELNSKLLGMERTT